jgi:hypothetical protein
VRQDLPRGNPHVRQAAHAAGNYEMAEIRVIRRSVS